METPDSENIEMKKETSASKLKFQPRLISPRNYTYVLAAFIVAGVLGGFAYYTFVGCRTGGCAITSNPYMSMAWGGILGYLLPDFFVKKSRSKDTLSDK